MFCVRLVRTHYLRSCSDFVVLLCFYNASLGHMYYQCSLTNILCIVHLVASNAGDVTCMATIPADMEVEAHFLAKEDGVIAGIVLAESVFSEVDPTLKVLRAE